MNIEETITSVLSDFNSFNMDDIPNIDLYMDQVTTYLNNKFVATKRKEEDKLLTKTMINNYAKSRLLPPPEKKKYTKDHIIVLSMIYFFKNVISINDITTVISPLLDEYFHNNNCSLEAVFNQFIEFSKSDIDSNSIYSTYERSKDCFKDFDSDNHDYLQTLTLIAMLSCECLSRKLIIEKLIDSFPQIEHEEKSDKTANIDKELKKEIKKSKTSKANKTSFEVQD